MDSESNSLFWLSIGFIGQLVFTSRFIVQWIKSERRKESYIPHIFWYLSIVGSVLLLSYAISIKAWPIILGQAFGVIVYGRNLALIARSKNAAAAAAQNAEDSSSPEDNQQN
ncbi:MAG: lipid-A-disaccharide synthase N-terminal domain-containing protein [Planctomycetota bacterium]